MSQHSAESVYNARGGVYPIKITSVKNGVKNAVRKRRMIMYPKKRNLDGVYFRVERDGKWENVCFTDLSSEEVEKITADKPVEWWKGLALALSDAIRDIGYVCDVERECGNG